MLMPGVQGGVRVLACMCNAPSIFLTEMSTMRFPCSKLLLVHK